MGLNSEPLKQDSDLLRMIDEGIAALQDDEAFTFSVQALKDAQQKDEKQK